MLQEETSHGYEIMQRLQEEFGFEQISPGSVYRSLRQLENEGLCHTAWEPPEGGHASRLYSITDEGGVFLEAWVEACEQYRWVEDTLSRFYRRRSRTPKKSSEK